MEVYEYAHQIRTWHSLGLQNAKLFYHFSFLAAAASEIDGAINLSFFNEVLSFLILTIEL